MILLVSMKAGAREGRTIVECFLGNEDTAGFIRVTSVERITRHLFEQVLVGFKHLVVSTLEVSAVGLIPQRIVADPAEHKASHFVRHPELDAPPSGNPMVTF